MVDIITNSSAKILSPIPGALYRKSLSIAASADGAQTNYQIMLNVYYGAGTSTGASVYLNSKCKTDFSDLIFTSSDASTKIDYWLESKTDSTSAIVWVEVPSIPATVGTTIYLYYGNASATSASNGANTFPFFDDFPNSSIDTNKWESIPAQASVSSSILTFPGGNPTWRFMYGKYTSNATRAIRFRFNSPSAQQAVGWQHTVNANSREFAYSAGWYNCGDTGTATQTTGRWTNGNWYVADLRRVSGTNVKNYLGTTLDTTVTTNVGTLTNPPVIGAYDTTNLLVDWIFVHNYTANEPAPSTWGSETSLMYTSPTGGLLYID